MKVKYITQNNDLTIYLEGELDEYSASKIREGIDGILENSSNISRVIFDFSSLGFMDSTGIGMLIGRYKKIKSRGIKVFIQNPSKSVEKVIEISGLYRIMPKI